jgi:YidC/Oxa1 family membrane protein insertase
MVQLSKLPYKVIFRSHPEYEKRKKKNFQKIQKLISASKMMSIDEMPDITERLPASDILITDRSGISFEFAFGTGRPVLFIETSLKQTNPDWPEIQIEPLENSLRSEMGITLLPSELNKLGEKLALLENFTTGFSEKMQVLKKEIFFNSPDNYRRGVDFIAKKINKKE